MGIRWVLGFAFCLWVSSLSAQSQQTEIKILLDPSAWKHLSLKLAAAHHEQVYFFDTIDRHAEKHDLVLRLRIQDGDKWISTVKLRPLPPEIPKSWYEWKRFKHESDIVGSRVIDSAAYSTSALQSKDLRRKFKNRALSLNHLFSRKQMEMIRWRYRDLDFSKLRVLGPVDAHSWDVDLGEGLVGKIERWTIRGQSDFEVVELSVKVPDYYSQCHHFLRGLGLKPLASPKTKSSLVTSRFTRSK